MKQKTIFITGSGSFIAKELIQACASQGIDCRGVDMAPTGVPNSFEADISKDDLAPFIEEGTDAIVHLAAVSRDGDFKKDPRKGYEANLIGTANVMEAAKVRGVKQVIFASSEWVYGDVGDSNEQKETDIINIASNSSEYAVSKLMGEQILRLGLEGSGVNLAVLRFGIVYGTRTQNWSAVEAIFNSVLTKDEVEVGSLNTARRFIHVKDIASGIIAALGTEGQHVLNLSGDRLVSLGDIIEESKAITGRSPLVTERASQSISVRNPVNNKAKEVLKWEPQVNLESGLNELFELLS